MTDALLAEIENFQSRTGLSDHRIGILVANNGRLLERLRSGGRVWPETERRIRGFIAVHRETGSNPANTDDPI